jgi:hypothetical protein
MSAVHFSGSASTTDRRRRLLVTETDPEFEEPDAPGAAVQNENANGSAAFPMLSGDRLIRRVISPRLWKHVTVAVVLTLIPIIYAVVTWPLSGQSPIGDQILMASRLGALRGLSGLQFFAAAQFCMVIAWVRSASAVDFRGRYRWWRWMSVGLFAASLMLLTGTGRWITDVIALGLEPLFGRIEAARPALILVPAGACIALFLRHVIPDMGRCRLAQALLVISVVLLVVRAFAGARQSSAAVVFHLSTLELLISALALSAFQLHARFVIHVNPNPPVDVQQKPVAVPVLVENQVPVEAAAQIVELQPAAAVVTGSPVVRPTGETTLPAAEKYDIDHDAITRKAAVTAPPIETQSQGNGKNNKKQKYRKAG